jgi:hypothetical protein
MSRVPWARSLLGLKGCSPVHLLTPHNIQPSESMPTESLVINAQALGDRRQFAHAQMARVERLSLFAWKDESVPGLRSGISPYRLLYNQVSMDQDGKPSALPQGQSPSQSEPEAAASTQIPKRVLPEPSSPPPGFWRRCFRFLGDLVNRHHFRAYVKDPRAWVEAIGIVILGFYTYYAGRQWHAIDEQRQVMDKQFKIMRGQLDQMKGTSLQADKMIAETHNLAEAAKAQADATGDLANRALAQATATNKLATETKRSADIAQRHNAPWVGIEDNTVTINPQLGLSWAAPPGSTIATINVAYAIKNFGSEPATYTVDLISAMAYRNGLKPLEWLQSFCHMSTGVSASGADTNAVGEMILPGARRQSGRRTNVQLNPEQQHIERIWIFICIGYQDGLRQTHWSRYLYLTRNSGAPVAFPGHPDWTYIPVVGAVLDSADAK